MKSDQVYHDGSSLYWGGQVGSLLGNLVNMLDELFLMTSLVLGVDVKTPYFLEG